jgi:prepilin-type N-terminal cleavage/methylation domain-containing protein
MKSGRPGFTLVEVMVASAVGLLVLGGVLSIFIWALGAAFECNQNAWVQADAVKSSQRILSYARNAMGVRAIDAAGTWVELSMPATGVVSRFSYVNPTAGEGDGRLIFVPDLAHPLAGTQLVATAVTEVMSQPSRNFFQQTGPQTLRVAYRVARRSRHRMCSAEVDFGVRLRNH